jgi:CRISPR-associated endonuclease Csn1
MAARGFNEGGGVELAALIGVTMDHLAHQVQELTLPHDRQFMPKIAVGISCDDRNPKDGSSLAVTHRLARQRRRRCDRFLKRRCRLAEALLRDGVFPQDHVARFIVCQR